MLESNRMAWAKAKVKTKRLEHNKELASPSLSSSSSPPPAPKAVLKKKVTYKEEVEVIAASPARPTQEDKKVILLPSGSHQAEAEEEESSDQEADDEEEEEAPGRVPFHQTAFTSSGYDKAYKRAQKEHEDRGPGATFPVDLESFEDE
jgi:hypothetical protein